ncbi:MAG: hypothetical protein ACI9VI_000549 [Candidatus Azotimanducaceae bacterium]|jgi:hypothetical protein
MIGTMMAGMTITLLPLPPLVCSGGMTESSTGEKLLIDDNPPVMKRRQLRMNLLVIHPPVFL